MRSMRSMHQRDHREPSRSSRRGLFPRVLAASALAALVTLGAIGGKWAIGRPPGAPAPAGSTAAVIVKGPYLQALGQTGVTLKVELSAPGPASVVVLPAGAGAGDGGAAGITRESTEARPFQALRVEGLAPATAYEYRVTAGGVTGEPGHFTTAPADARPFRFLAYGDSRSNPEAHAAVVHAMEAVPADLLVNSGDMVVAGNDPRAWAELFTVEGHLLRDRCVFAAVGNHELSRGDHAGEVAFLRYFAEAEEGRPLERLYGSFRWSNTRFFVLNAMDNWTGDERAWLRAELEHADAEPGLAHRIVVLHWGPFSSGPHGGNPALAANGVIETMVAHHVDLLIAGHDHQYERGEGRGLKYVITGGAGAPLYQRKFQAPETRTFESAYHFVEVAVDGDKVHLTARRPDGAVLEACGYQGAGSWDCDPEKKAAAPAGEPSAAPGASPGAGHRPAACGCRVPGAADETGGAAALAVAVALAWARRRRA
jgi:MYXO-CTERM domain-containing protein